MGRLTVGEVQINKKTKKLHFLIKIFIFMTDTFLEKRLNGEIKKKYADKKTAMINKSRSQNITKKRYHYANLSNMQLTGFFFQNSHSENDINRKKCIFKLMWKKFEHSQVTVGKESMNTIKQNFFLKKSLNFRFCQKK